MLQWNLEIFVGPIEPKAGYIARVCTVMQCVLQCMLQCVVAYCSAIIVGPTELRAGNISRSCTVMNRVLRCELQCVSVCCSVLQCDLEISRQSLVSHQAESRKHFQIMCSDLPFVAVCVAVCCSVLQCDIEIMVGPTELKAGSISRSCTVMHRLLQCVLQCALQCVVV